MGLLSHSVRELEKDPLILFSSWQSVYAKTVDLRAVEFRALRDYKPDLVVVDEAHYGKSGDTEAAVYENLFDRYWDGVPMLGLSGTPKVRAAHGWSKKKLGNIYFSWLVKEGHLAKPIVIEKTIPAEVKIQFDEKTNWIKNESEIGADRKRNTAIVDYYLSKREEFRKTLIFAIDVAHANRLASALRDKGEKVIAVHSGTTSNPQDNIDDFRRGHYKVAVAVDMMNEGIDVPDINTIFLSRPVTSEILFAQMVGRGCRLIEGKKNSFFLVDFYSQTETGENSRHLMHYKDWYNCEEGGRLPVLREGHARRYSKHVSNFVPAMRTLKYEPASEFYSSLHGLKIDEAQTFGLEFELFAKGVNLKNSKEWMKTAIPLWQHLRECFGADAVAQAPEFTNPKVINHEVWNVVFDATCGFEVVTPILKGRDGFESVVKFLRSLEKSGLALRHGLDVNMKTGTHVHLGWRYNDPEKIRDILFFMRKFEAAFHTLIAPSRVVDANGEPNEYCQSVASRFGINEIKEIQTSRDVKRVFGKYEERYCAINLTNFDTDSSTLEVRSHHGTLNNEKIVLWVALWMNVHNALERIRIDVLNVEDTKKEPTMPNEGESSDILFLATQILGISVVEEPEMLSRLNARRQELICNKWWTAVLGSERVSQILKSWSDRAPGIRWKRGA